MRKPVIFNKSVNLALQKRKLCRTSEERSIMPVRDDPCCVMLKKGGLWIVRDHVMKKPVVKYFYFFTHGGVLRGHQVVRPC